MVPLEQPMVEAEYQGKNVELNSPKRSDGPKKFVVYVKDGDKVKKVNFGNMIGADDDVKINDKDIITNLPYVSGCHLAFDHHSSEISRIEKPLPNHIIDPEAPSAARVLFNYYGGKERFHSSPYSIFF